MDLVKGLLERSGINFDEYEKRYREAADLEKRKLYREAAEVIPTRPVIGTDDFEDGGSVPRPEGSGQHSPPRDSVSRRVSSPRDQSECSPLTTYDHKLPSKEKSDHKLDGFFTTDDPLTQTSHRNGNDFSPLVGEKRPGRELNVSSQKHQRVLSPSSNSRIRFERPAHGIMINVSSQKHQSVPSAFTILRELATRPSFGSSCTFGTVAASSSSSSSSSSASLPPITRPGFTSDQYPPPASELITSSDWDQIRSVAGFRMGIPTSHSSSERAGSALVPPPDNEFNKTLGEKNYIAPWKLRIMDDGRDPAVARDLIDCVVPPIRYAESTFRSTGDLARNFDVSALDSLINGALLRQRLFEDNEKLSNLVEHFRKEMHKGIGNLETLGRELVNEKGVSTRLRESNDQLESKCLELKTNVEDLTRDKQSLMDEVAQLKSKLALRDVVIKRKDAEIEGLKSSFQEQIDGLRAEIAEERGLKASLVTRVKDLEAEVVTVEAKVDSALQLRRDTLAAFPELFRKFLDYPDVKRVFDDFNKASFAMGKHVASSKLLKTRPDLKGCLPELNPRAYGVLKDADAAFRSKAFPLLELIVRDLDAPMDDILAIFAPPAPAT